MLKKEVLYMLERARELVTALDEALHRETHGANAVFEYCKGDSRLTEENVDTIQDVCEKLVEKYQTIRNTLNKIFSTLALISQSCGVSEMPSHYRTALRKAQETLENMRLPSTDRSGTHGIRQNAVEMIGKILRD